jgi:hypothetical protein
MYRRLLLAALVIPAAGALSAAEAQERLITIASKEINLAGAGRECLYVGDARGAFRGIRVVAKRGDVPLTQVQVHYNDGTVHSEDRLINLLAGERSRPIDPRAGSRFIDHVTVTARPGRGSGVLEVVGIQTSDGWRKRRLASQRPLRCGSSPSDAIAKGPSARPQDLSSMPTSALPTTVAPGKLTAGGDLLFGVQYVGFGVDRDVIRVGGEIGKFDRIRFRVLDNDVHINEVKIVYMDGTADPLAVNADIKENSRTNWLNVRGDKFIQEIQMSYRSRPSLKGQARIEVFGEYSDNWLGPGGEGRKYNQGWVLLGAQTAGFVGFDKDLIPVGRNEGGFKRIRVSVKDRAITLNELRVVYASGEEDIVPVKTRVDAGSSYGPIDLKGSSRAIKEIQARYRSRFIDTKALGKGNAIVEVWGQH